VTDAVLDVKLSSIWWDARRRKLRPMKEVRFSTYPSAEKVLQQVGLEPPSHLGFVDQPFGISLDHLQAAGGPPSTGGRLRLRWVSH
jgi:hypothetical protein